MPSSKRGVLKNTGKRGRRGKNKSTHGSALTTSKGNSAALTLVSEPWMPIFPARTTKRLRYSTNVSIGAAVGAVNTWVFRANDLFDPDFTSGGHQPMGFDQMMLSYNHFCVTKAKITCTFRNLVTTKPVVVAIRQDANSTPLTVVDRIIEFGGLVQSMLGAGPGFGSTQTLELSLDVAKLQGLSLSALTADPTLRGDAATSPTEVTYFHVACWDTSGSVTTSVLCDIIVEQTAIFLEPRDLLESLKLLSFSHETKTSRVAPSLRVVR